MYSVLLLIYIFSFLLIGASIWARSISLALLAVAMLLMVAYQHSNRQLSYRNDGQLEHVVRQGYEEWQVLGMPPNLDRNINVVHFYTDLLEWKTFNQEAFDKSVSAASTFLDPTLRDLDALQNAALNAWNALEPFSRYPGYRSAREQWDQITRQQLTPLLNSDRCA